MIVRIVLLLLVAGCYQASCSSERSDWPVFKSYPESWKHYVRATLMSSYEMLKNDWQSFKEKYNKNYKSKEDLKRMEIFAQNKLFIAQHNDLYKKGVVTFTLKMNQFGDMTKEEFKHYYLLKNTKTSDAYMKKNTMEINPRKFQELPREKDWRKEGAVTEVKDQGSCGSCWAFSATGALEAYFHRKYKYLVSLSEQNLIDCSVEYDNYGCVHGKPYNAMKYTRAVGGIDTEISYPYIGRSQQCKFDKKYAVPSPVVITFVPISENALMYFVGYHGPVSVVVDVSDETFTFYEQGVYYSRHCSDKLEHLNHAMLVVGYGVADFGGEYWLVKNSWGKDWGEEGYVRMAKNHGNNCGIATEAVYPF